MRTFQPILREALAKWVLDARIVSLVEIDPALSRGYTDDALIRELAARGVQGLLTCDDNMVYRTEVLEAIDDTNFSVVTFRRVGHDPVKASGLLLVHLSEVVKRYEHESPQIWQIGSAEVWPTDFYERLRSAKRHGD